ncbi:MaoC family dehydratase [Rapidithrix thailandica]|uniref:MaoC family dehydratase n=1 Tax=Rapidithrix thailandica TaxID=413964 RepID=A0AAW9S2F1_9BACT
MAKLQVGDMHESEFSLLQNQVNAFAELTGDHNPLHLDAEYAAKTVFKRPIIHGFLSASIFSKVLGTEFPGEGSVYLSQQMAFKRPMYVETLYKAVFTIEEVNEAKHTARISTRIFDATTNKLTVEGSAEVMNKEML